MKFARDYQNRSFACIMSMMLLWSMLYSVFPQSTAAAQAGLPLAAAEQTGLLGLDLSAGTLSPDFESRQSEYTADVSEHISQITATPTAENAGDTIYVSINGDPAVEVASGSASPPLSLEIGRNVVAVKVTSSDGQTSRIYRVAVDKSSVVLQQGVGGYTGQKDAHVSEGSHGSKNTGLHNAIEVGYFDPLMTDRKFGLLQFDLATLPSEASLTEATLDLHLIGTRVRSGDRFDKTLFLHEITSAWEEGTGTGFDGTAGAPGVIWETRPGFDSEVLDSKLVGIVSNQWYSWNLTALAQSWLQGGKENYGVILKELDSQSDAETIKSTKNFASAQHADPTSRPRLTLRYTMPLTGINLASDSLDLTVGQAPVELAPTAFVRPLNAALIGGLEWTSDNEEVATVDASGTVTPVGEGTTVIRAAVSDAASSFADEVQVRVAALESAGVLSGLSVEGVELQPGFLPAVHHYETEVPLNARQVSITPIAMESDAEIIIYAGEGEPQTVASGSRSLPVPLEPGTTMIRIRVVSTDVSDPEEAAEVFKEYSITVKYRDTGGAGDDIIREFLNPNGRVLVVAHRGNWLNGLPENGLDSIRESIDEGVDMVELDIRTTSDGVPVLMHDTTVNRTTNGSGSLSSFTLAQLKQLCLKNSDGSVSNPCERVPTLEEAMELARGSIMVNLDIKNADWDTMWDILVRTDTTDHALYKTSAGKASTAAWMAQFKDSAVQPLFMQLTSNPDTAFDFLNPETTPFTVHAFEVSFNDDNASVMNPEFIQEIHSRGARVWVNTIFSVPGMVGRHGDYAFLSDPNAGFPWLVARGVDMIQTDTTALLLKYLRGELGGGSNPPGFTHTIELQQGLNQYSGTADASIIEAPGSTSNNNGANGEMAVGYNSTASNDRKQGLIRFDLSSIPEEAVVTKAVMELFLVRNGDGARDKTLYVHEVQGAWEEGTGTGLNGTANASGVNWANRPVYDPNAVDSKVIGTESLVWNAFDVSQLTKRWHEDSSSNYGVLLKDSDESRLPPMKIFATSENAWQSWRPKLSVTYTIPAAGVEITPNVSTLQAGEQMKLNAKVMPETALNTMVVWTSSDANVARVGSDGTVTAVSKGTAIITATTLDGGHYAEAQITVERIGQSVNLGALGLSAGSLTTPFAPDSMLYTAEVPEVYNHLAVTAFAEDEQATLTLSHNGGQAVPLVSGEPSAALPLEIGDNILLITVAANNGANHKTYKITIPKAAVALQEGIDGYTGTADTQLSKGTGGQGNRYYQYNLGAQYGFEVGYYNQTVDDEKYGLVRFDALPIPEGATITEASLNLYHYNQRSNARARDIFVHRANAPWVEGTGGSGDSNDGSPALPGEVTWENYITNGSNPFEAAPSAQQNINAVSQWYAFGITDIVQDWVDGAEVNNGVLLKPQSYPNSSDATMTGTKKFYTKDYTNPLLRPYLRIVYQMPASGIVLDRSTLELAVGGGGDALNAIVKPLNAIDSTVVWSSDNESIAMVDQTGHITPISEGIATITAVNVNGDEAHAAVTVRRQGTLAELLGLTLSSGQLSPAFSPAQHAYNAIIPANTHALIVTPTTTDPHAVISIRLGEGEPQQVSSGTASLPINIRNGEEVVIEVTSEDGQSMQSYRVRIVKKSGLHNIQLSTGSLSPVFSTERLQYAAQVSAATTEISLRPYSIDTEAIIRLSSPSGMEQSIESGQQSGSIALAPGANIVWLEVLEPSASERIVYTLVINRATAAISGTGYIPVTGTQAAETVALGDELKVAIPQEEAGIKLTLEKLATETSTAPYDALSLVYAVTMENTRKLSKPLTLTLAFDRSRLADGRASVFRYDELRKQWIEIGGDVQGGVITVATNEVGKFAVHLVDNKPADTPNEPSQPATPWTDLRNHWAERTVAAAVERGIVAGYPDGSMRPDEQITRAEFAAMLVRARGLNEESGNTFEFADAAIIPEWAEKSLQAAVSAGIISGYTDGTIRPNQLINRAEMITMLMRAYPMDEAPQERPEFKDGAAIPAWSQASVFQAAQLGIVVGYQGEFKPASNATRAEAVSVMIRLLEL